MMGLGVEVEVAVCALTVHFVYVPPKHWFLQEQHGITSQRTAFFDRNICSGVQTMFRMLQLSQGIFV
jgi:hypothetical protein